MWRAQFTGRPALRRTHTPPYKTCHIVTPPHTHHISPVCICLDKLKNKYIVYNNLFQMSGFKLHSLGFADEVYYKILFSDIIN